MSEIRRYVLVDAFDNEQDYEYESFREAREAAERAMRQLSTEDYPDNGYAVIERTYVYDDSELVWTPDGSNTWPPEGGEL